MEDTSFFANAFGIEPVKKTRKPGGGRTKGPATKTLYKRIRADKYEAVARIVDGLLADDELLTRLYNHLRSQDTGPGH